jgi:hypothetical protein
MHRVVLSAIYCKCPRRHWGRSCLWQSCLCCSSSVWRKHRQPNRWPSLKGLRLLEPSTGKSTTACLEQSQQLLHTLDENKNTVFEQLLKQTYVCVFAFLNASSLRAWRCYWCSQCARICWGLWMITTIRRLKASGLMVGSTLQLGKGSHILILFRLTQSCKAG